MNIGDKVMYGNRDVATIVNIYKPKCMCKGGGHYTLDLNGSVFNVPLNSKLEPHNSIGLISTQVNKHTF